MERAFVMLIIIALQFLSAPIDFNREIENELRSLNAQEVYALMHYDIKNLIRLWSDDFVVTNPLNKFVDKQQVVELIESKTLAFKAYDRQIEYIRIHDATAVVAGNETVVWAGKMP